ncbi:MAG TPA: YciI family protein [Thermoanaerobaculia bacterium]|jgi:hypothetical protein
MPKFVLLLRDTGTYPKDSAEEIQKIVQRYRDWSQKVQTLAGNKLKDREGRVMKRGSVTDGPYVESKEVIGGFQLIEARDYDEAVRKSGDHPHLQFGTIEIRQVDEM